MADEKIAANRFPGHAPDADVHSLKYCGVAEYLFAPPCFHSWQVRILQPAVSPDHAPDAGVHLLKYCGVAEYLFAPPCFHSWQVRILQPAVSPTMRRKLSFTC